MIRLPWTYAHTLRTELKLYDFPKSFQNSDKTLLIKKIMIRSDNSGMDNHEEVFFSN